jgi:hypothetical protein
MKQATKTLSQVLIFCSVLAALPAGAFAQSARERVTHEVVGAVRSTEEVRIVREPRILVLEPVVERVVYVPSYTTRIVYGDRRWAHSPPLYWHTPPVFYSNVTVIQQHHSHPRGHHKPNHRRGGHHPVYHSRHSHSPHYRAHPSGQHPHTRYAPFDRGSSVGMTSPEWASQRVRHRSEAVQQRARRESAGSYRHPRHETR